MNIQSARDKKIIRMLRQGEIGVLPTDTLYGIVGSARIKKTVERIYNLRKRNPKKPMIVLIGSIGELKTFSVKLTDPVQKQLNRIWPGKVSVILPCASKKFLYLHRGTKTIAFRFPAPARLRNVLKKTGPLVAPSANTEGKPTARTLREAKKYFGDRVDFYDGVGRISSKPSTLVTIHENGHIQTIRKGGVKI